MTHLSNPVDDALISPASGAALGDESFPHAAEAVGVDHTEFLLSDGRRGETKMPGITTHPGDFHNLSAALLLSKKRDRVGSIFLSKLSSPRP